MLLAMRSETGTAWVVSQVPGLDVIGGQGSLLSRWQANSLTWRGLGIDLQLQSPDVQWSPECLMQQRLCLEHLRAQSIKLNLPPAKTSDKVRSDIKLPNQHLPLAIRADSIRLGEFYFNDNKIWDKIELDSIAEGDSLLIDRAFYQHDDIKASASGWVKTRGDWPVALQLHTTLPPASDIDWRLDLALTGSIRELRFSGSSQGYLNATIKGKVEPLRANLPARLTIHSDRFLASPTLPATLALNELNVVLRGSLAKGFNTRGQAMLASTDGPIALNLAAKVMAQGVDNVELTLESSSNGQKESLALTGSAAWLPELSADASLNMTALPWFTLLPNMQPPAVNIETLQLKANWQNQRYNATLAASLKGPAGDAQIESDFEGDLTQLTISRLQVLTGAGDLSGKATIGLVQPISWRSTLQLQQFNPAYWLPSLPASLNGSIHSSGQWSQSKSTPEMVVGVDLIGLWRGETGHLKADISANEGQWQLPHFDLAIGKNSLTAQAQWGQQAEVQIDLNLSQPSAIIEGLKGQANGHLTVTGNSKQPQADLNLSATGLAWQDLHLASIDLGANLDSKGVINSQLQLLGIKAAGQFVDQLDATLQGSTQSHQLAIEMINSEIETQLTFAGAFNESWQQWRGALKQGELLIIDQHQRWQISEPAALVFNAATQGEKAQLSFAKHCWQWQQSSLCAGDQTLLPTAAINYQIINLPTQALVPLLPEDLTWQANINGSIELNIGANGPSGSINVEAGQGIFQIQLEDEWQQLSHTEFSTKLVLWPSKAQLQLKLAGPKLGLLQTNLNIDPASTDRNVNGTFKVNKMDIALLGIFTGLEEVAGQISGQAKLSGPLLRPAIKGKLVLSEGKVVDPQLPLAMEHINANIEMLGYSANLNGLIKANQHGELILKGALNWQDNLPSGKLTLRGEQLPINIEPFAKLDIKPDLTIGFALGELTITGRVDVPRGEVNIQGLPPQAVSLSNDEIIIGQEKSEPIINSLMMDVAVNVGSRDDKVTFSAFGATGDLSGALRIGNNINTNGTLQLNNGRFEAYGQDLDLRKAQLLFIGNLSQPYLQLEAVRRVGSVVAGLRLSGLAQSPTTEVFSNPEMPQTDALSYIVLGRAPQSGSDEGQMSRAVLSLGLNKFNKITGALGEELGIRDLSLEAEGSGEQTAVVASGYLTEDLSIRYGIGIFEPVNTMALRYDLGRYFYLEAASGLAASLDIFYTRDF